MEENRPKVSVAIRPHGTDWELCVMVTSADGETQLEHEDFLLTEAELKSLKQCVDGVTK